jgi:hypothetical protein
MHFRHETRHQPVGANLVPVLKCITRFLLATRPLGMFFFWKVKEVAQLAPNFRVPNDEYLLGAAVIFPSNIQPTELQTNTMTLTLHEHLAV